MYNVSYMSHMSDAEADLFKQKILSCTRVRLDVMNFMNGNDFDILT